LKDYLDDPNFEQNRIEYKLQKDSADKNGKAPVVKKSSGNAVQECSRPFAELLLRHRKVRDGHVFATSRIWIDV
jgi:hypothetical protein